MNNFQISPLFKKNRELKEETKNLRRENLKLYIFIICSTLVILIAVGLLGRNLFESHQLSYESSTLFSAIEEANNVIKTARIEADKNQKEAESEAASIVAAADEKASEIICSAKEGK